jgi:hypothetical protein
MHTHPPYLALQRTAIITVLTQHSQRASVLWRVALQQLITTENERSPMQCQSLSSRQFVVDIITVVGVVVIVVVIVVVTIARTESGTFGVGVITRVSIGLHHIT